MSFDFDPNVNIDRAEDDNDPEDMASYPGGEGLYGRVPGGPQVGAANRSMPMVGLGWPEEVRYQGVPDKPRAHKARWDVYHPTCP